MQNRGRVKLWSSTKIKEVITDIEWAETGVGKTVRNCSGKTGKTVRTISFKKAHIKFLKFLRRLRINTNLVFMYNLKSALKSANTTHFPKMKSSK